MVELSVVVPAYNASGFISDTVQALSFFARENCVSIEVIVVDDGSSDATAEALRNRDDCKLIQLPRNMGKGAALRNGMLHTTGKVCAFTDADLPYGAEPLLVAMHYIEQRGFHAVLGDRTLPGSTYAHSGCLRSFISGAASMVFRTLVTGGIFDTQCGFKAFRGDVAREIFRLSLINGFAIDVELIYLLLKYRLDVKRMRVQLRANAPSTVHVLRDTARSLRDIVQMRINWAMGAYNSKLLVDLLEEDLTHDHRCCTPVPKE